jgi:hypothetical protein
MKKHLPLLLAAIAAAALGTVFKLRLLPFLQGDFIESGGKQVSAANFAARIANMFTSSARALPPLS